MGSRWSSGSTAAAGVLAVATCPAVTRQEHLRRQEQEGQKYGSSLSGSREHNCFGAACPLRYPYLAWPPITAASPGVQLRPDQMSVQEQLI